MEKMTVDEMKKLIRDIQRFSGNYVNPLEGEGGFYRDKGGVIIRIRKEILKELFSNNDELIHKIAMNSPLYKEVVGE